MRYGRRATVFSTTAISWVCVLCSAVTGAWLMDLIPISIPKSETTLTESATSEIETTVSLDGLLPGSQSEPLPAEGSQTASLETSISQMANATDPAFGVASFVQEQRTNGSVQTGFADSMIQQTSLESVSSDCRSGECQTIQPSNVVEIPHVELPYVELNEPASFPAMNSASHTAEQPSGVDPFAAFLEKERKLEFVAAQPGMPAQAQTEVQTAMFEDGWQTQATPTKTVESSKTRSQEPGRLYFSSIETPQITGSGPDFNPMNPHSGRIQDSQTVDSQTPQRMTAQDMEQPAMRPGNTAMVETRTLTFNPERDQVRLLADPYRGESTLLPAEHNQVQQMDFATETPTNHSAMMTSFEQTPTTVTTMHLTPTTHELMDRVLSMPESSSVEPERKTPSQEIQRLRQLSELYWSSPQSRPDVQKEIDELARKIYFSPGVHYMTPYSIVPGDQLMTISKKYDVPWQYLARLNRVTPEKIRAGSELKVIKGPFSAIVDLSEFEMIIHAHGYYVCRFPIGCGKNDSTPVGSFTVKNKEINPVYYGADGVVAADDPANPLGERWIDLGDSYGIHGTIDPHSIGQAQSKGCIRLHNEQVEIVYDLLGIGSEVVITQ